MDITYTWSVSVDGVKVASGQANSKEAAVMEAFHYGQQYTEEVNDRFYLQIKRKLIA